MTIVNVHEAKAHFSSLLKKVARGEEVIIAKSGRPVARLVACAVGHRPLAPPGSMAASDAWIADDFDEPIDAIFESLGNDF